MTTPRKNDFDPNELIATSEEHEKTIGELHASVAALEKRVGSNANLAASFKAAFENDKKMDKVLVELVSHLIQTDENVKDAVAKAVNKTDRDWQASMFKKAGFAVWTLVVALISGAIVFLLSINTIRKRNVLRRRNKTLTVVDRDEFNLR